MSKSILVIGNLSDGFRFVGPFGSFEEAVEFSEGVDADNWVATLEEPEGHNLTAEAAPELLAAAKCALADLEGIMPEFEPDGSEHPGWKTIEELRAAINKAEGRAE